mgnify:CR=1 FL=1
MQSLAVSKSSWAQLAQCLFSQQTTGANGQVTVYIDPGEYRVSVNGTDSFKIVGRDDTDFGTSATANLTVGATDSTAGRVYKVGDDVGITFGTNANGEFTRFPDGTMICTRTLASTSQIITAEANLFRTASNPWTYPSTFVGSAPKVSGFVVSGAAYSWVTSGGSDTSISIARWAVMRAGSLAAIPTVTLTATGRWK